MTHSPNDFTGSDSDDLVTLTSGPSHIRNVTIANTLLVSPSGDPAP